MSKFTFLTKDQIFGKDRLEIFCKYGTKAIPTDFALLLGCNSLHSNKSMSSWWWTKSCKKFGNSGFLPYFVNYKDDIELELDESYEFSGGARPALPYSYISSNAGLIRNNNGIKEVSYGEYPQTTVSGKTSLKLEKAYDNGSTRTTGKNYTTNSYNKNTYNRDFIPRTFTEYEYKGKKYIRFLSEDYYLEYFDGIKTNELDPYKSTAYWIKVEPIIWLVDEKSDIALAKKILFSGLRFKSDHYYNGDFGNTNIKLFMDTCFSRDIGDKQQQRLENPYNFNFDEVSEEDIIRGAVESNVPVFLHGRSSEGKSARVKQLDPDCEIIYMRNATPDSLNGKSVYNSQTGEMIDVPPTWYQKVKEKCEKEPNKIHIIFFDELTNALPSIQGMAFNIILDGEVNGKWKLPSNARIVAAGNDLNDSLAANQMAEPLFNRFAHVYINTTVDSWLKWASTPKEKYKKLDYKKEELGAKIHPSIYAYIAYKSYSGKDVLRTPYTGDKPNADPRKWEMASKVLYKTKQPEMLRSLIGESLTRDFIAFARQQVISVDDVINHNYSIGDLEVGTSQKFATAVGLSSVDDEHFEVVRDFMMQLGEEPRAAFDSIWAHGDEKRLEKIAEIQMSNNLSKGLIKR